MSNIFEKNKCVYLKVFLGHVDRRVYYTFYCEKLKIVLSVVDKDGKLVYCKKCEHKNQRGIEEWLK
ncbi:MAG: hypothetical protein QXJ14_02565 [Candidatus Aenigmatarchaeota archaeon]